MTKWMKRGMCAVLIVLGASLLAGTAEAHSRRGGYSQRHHYGGGYGGYRGYSYGYGYGGGYRGGYSGYYSAPRGYYGGYAPRYYGGYGYCR